MTTTTTADVSRKPRDDELDLYGVTHRGKLRKENQDHFLYATLHKMMRVRGTSLPTPELLEIPSQRVASLAMVADGVGGTAAGEAASRAALEVIATYVTHTMQAYYGTDTKDDPEERLDCLRRVATSCHEHVASLAAGRPEFKGMATTLTLVMVAWPMSFVLHLGDSRCYRYRSTEDRLEQMTRDQTMAQDLVDAGALPADRAPKSPFSSILSSAIGSTAIPAVSVFEMRHGDVLLLCTDGLTKHVPDERIQARLRAMTSSRQVAEALLQDALDDGGSDNVTVFVGRAVVPQQEIEADASRPA